MFFNISLKEFFLGETLFWWIRLSFQLMLTLQLNGIIDSGWTRSTKLMVCLSHTRATTTTPPTSSPAIFANASKTEKRPTSSPAIFANASKTEKRTGPTSHVIWSNTWNAHHDYNSNQNKTANHITLISHTSKLFDSIHFRTIIFSVPVLIIANLLNTKETI